jgi:hypothetical protein
MSPSESNEAKELEDLFGEQPDFRFIYISPVARRPVTLTQGPHSEYPRCRGRWDADSCVISRTPALNDFTNRPQQSPPDGVLDLGLPVDVLRRRE